MDEQMMITLVVGGATLLVTLIIGFALVGGDDSSAKTKRRLAEVGAGHGPVSSGDTARHSARRQDQESSIKILDTIVRKFTPKPAELKIRLEKTGSNLSMAEYALISLVVAAATWFAMRFVYDLTWMLTIPAGILSGLMLPHMIVGYMGGRRTAKFLKNFPESIELLVRGLRAGLPISESIVSVSNDAPEPIATEFKMVADTVKFGGSIEEGLWDVARRIDTPDFKFLIIAISIQRETGGNLAETLSGLAHTLRQRRQIKLKIRAMSSEARASAWIIGSLPFIMFCLLWFVNEGYVGTLLTDPRGMYLIGLGLGMIGTGAAVMAKMIRFEI
jgi:tight adherence protein B